MGKKQKSKKQKFFTKHVIDNYHSFKSMLWIHIEINPFGPNAPFLYPLKTSKNRKVFCIDSEWVNVNSRSFKINVHFWWKCYNSLLLFTKACKLFSCKTLFEETLFKMFFLFKFLVLVVDSVMFYLLFFNYMLHNYGCDVIFVHRWT